MAYKTLGKSEMDYEKQQRVYFVGYCNSCRGKTLLCREEFESMMERVSYDIVSEKSLAWLVAKKLRLPKIRIYVEREGD